MKAALTPLQQGVWVLMGASFGGGPQNIHEDSCAWSELLLTFELSEKLNRKKKNPSEPMSPYQALNPRCWDTLEPMTMVSTQSQAILAVRCYCETLGHVILLSTVCLSPQSLPSNA